MWPQNNENRTVMRWKIVKRKKPSFVSDVHLGQFPNMLPMFPVASSMIIFAVFSPFVKDY